MVAAQIQVGRIVTDTFQTGGMEYVVDAQHMLGITVSVHISVSGSPKTVFEVLPQMSAMKNREAE